MVETKPIVQYECKYTYIFKAVDIVKIYQKYFQATFVTTMVLFPEHLDPPPYTSLPPYGEVCALSTLREEKSVGTFIL